LLFPVYKPHTFLSPGYQDNLGWGFATALGAQHARPDAPVVAITGDGGFMYTASELATAVASPHSADHGRVQRRRIW
jgi:acetolactate synthase-1/2/3 large subunit